MIRFVDHYFLSTLVADIIDEAGRSSSLDALHSLRDPTRGGLATTLNEIALSAEVKAEPGGIVTMRTGFGGTRIVDMLVGEQLPRICQKP